MKPRKQREPRPPSMLIRSSTGTVAKLTRTGKWNHHDEWLYRLRFNIYGHEARSTQLWSVPELIAWGATFIEENQA